MLIGARTGVWSGGGAKPWANPYITDGLVAMWDGEWNAGGGVHDANVTVWKDLVGNADLSQVSGRTMPSFESNCIRFSSNSEIIASGQEQIFKDLLLNSEYTFSIVFVVEKLTSSYSNNFGIFDFSSLSLRSHVSDVSMRYLRIRGLQTYFNSSGSSVIGTNHIVNETIISDGATKTELRNDVKIKEVSFTGGSADPNGVIEIGRFVDDRYGSTRWDGRVFRVSIYNRALTAAEIAANYAVDKARFGLS